MTYERKFRIATRKSALALWQANCLKSYLESQGACAELVCLTTTGDKMQKGALSNVQLKDLPPHLATGKGLFVKEIQEALLSSEADFAVHSMKDVPFVQTEGLTLCALMERDSAEDVLVVSSRVRKALKATALSQLTPLEFRNRICHIFPTLRCGTSSVRRQHFVRSFFPETVRCEVLRGNVDSRLRKVRENEFDLILLSRAGVDRLGLFNKDDMISLPTAVSLPAPAQGTIGIEARCDDLEAQKFVSALNTATTLVPVAVERLILGMLGGDCHMAIAAYCPGHSVSAWCLKGSKFSKLDMDISEFADELSLCFVKASYAQTTERLLSTRCAKQLQQRLLAAGFDLVGLAPV